MQIINKIDQLISKLNSLKPVLSSDASRNEEKFNEVLRSTLEIDYSVNDGIIETKPMSTSKAGNGLPRWVDPEYDYNPLEPRKPNMRELMEAISGKTVEALYTEPDEEWINISRQATEILYGVVGSNNDARDWQLIMASENILKAAQEQTGSMYGTKVAIETSFDDTGGVSEQIAVIKDKNDVTLRSLSNNIKSTELALKSFGATKESIPQNLEDQIYPEKFDDDLLAFLKTFDNKPTTVQQVVLQSASEVIANKLSQEIPLDELEKL